MIIVTGGAGAIGSALVWQLNQQGIDDLIVVDNLASTAKWKNLAHVRFADYVQKNDLHKLLPSLTGDRRPKAIVHLGACSATTETNVDYLMDNNTRYTQNLAQWAVDHGVRFLYASSAATYGGGEHGYGDDDDTARRLTPLNAYGYSKQRFDEWAMKTGLNRKILGLKFFNVYGPNEYHKGSMTSAVFKAWGQIKETGRMRLFKSERPDVADGCQRRDFVYVKDCVAAMAWLLDQPHANGLLNLGAGQARTWIDLTTAVCRAMDHETRIEYIDMPESLRGQYQYFTQADMTKLHAWGCPVRFHSLEDGVRDYIQNYLEPATPHLNSKTNPQPSTDTLQPTTGHDPKTKERLPEGRDPAPGHRAA